MTLLYAIHKITRRAPGTPIGTPVPGYSWEGGRPVVDASTGKLIGTEGVYPSQTIEPGTVFDEPHAAIVADLLKEAARLPTDAEIAEASL